MYHLSDSISGAEEKKEETSSENRIWRKFIALKDTSGLIFNLVDQEMDNHTAVVLPSQAYHIATTGKCFYETSEKCMFGS